MARSKNIVLTELAPPTLEQRQDQLARRTETALGVFVQAATELEIAADELDKVAVEAAEIADRHEVISLAADEAAATNRRNADKIRSLFN